MSGNLQEFLLIQNNIKKNKNTKYILKAVAIVLVLFVVKYNSITNILAYFIAVFAEVGLFFGETYVNKRLQRYENQLKVLDGEVVIDPPSRLPIIFYAVCVGIIVLTIVNKTITYGI